MKTMTFKTNAKCNGCLIKIEEILKGKINREDWNLDLSNFDHILTVTSDKMSANEIIELISKDGFKIEQIK